MFGKRRKVRGVPIPFTRAEYISVVENLRNLILDPEFDFDPSEDPETFQIMQQFVAEGIWDFHQVLNSAGPHEIEIKLGHDVAKAIVYSTIEEGDANPDLPPSLVAGLVVRRVPLEVPVARGHLSIAVNRAELAVLNATCSTFLTLSSPESPNRFSLDKVEAISQCIGLVWTQWFFWARPLIWSENHERNP